MMGRSQWHTLRPLGQPDFGFVLTGLTLALLGLLMVASSSIEVASDRHGSPFSFAIKHGIFLVIALGAGAITFMVPTKWWYRSATLFLVFSLVLLALVLIPGIGLEVKGARRWLDLGVINLQPSEVAKFTMMLYLAAYLVRRLEEVRTQFMGFLKPMAVVGLIAALLLAEPDFGTLMLIVLAVMGVLLLAGAPFNQYLMIGAAVVVGLAALAIIEPYRIQRFNVLLDPWDDRLGAGYQITQALLAFGRGGWFGLGLGNSVQKLFYLPEAHTDFVFAILAEELGLIGALSTLGLMSILVWRGLLIGRRAERDGRHFAAYLCYGLVLIIGLQMLVNLAVNVGIAPTTGLTLPLMSYGGSSLVVTMASLGVIARISADSIREGRR
ncbi:MAG: putative lipid II flippase FtsW [Litorivicinaceae bacterium]|jgi:cell division protein FtsW|nr:putative lipid II flippase FtsW [Litorivicinaceae bacterium]MDP5328551.1 putative lipid II flippase FtsW [Litorivicinaceae bacterium]MDP5330498.1 putative lipid II flippase FtsW [Litorivicinaceae bacterium]MDP5340989.1 putative lipid II flippase FtsW [Litorivicinaceae bacterium]MDP5342022.1 putative lipid II flippase FtsW [Litorivicinaceae bacterium]